MLNTLNTLTANSHSILDISPIHPYPVGPAIEAIALDAEHQELVVPDVTMNEELSYRLSEQNIGYGLRHSEAYRNDFICRLAEIYEPLVKGNLEGVKIITEATLEAMTGTYVKIHVLDPR